MAKVISFGIQKGGSAKTTTSGVVAHLLSQDHRVLAVDLDSQGNLTELIMQRDIYDFHGYTVLEAMKERNARPYIQKSTESLHVLTADDLLATFSRWLYTEYHGDKSAVLKETLNTVHKDYDFVILDTPPALGDQTINALAASDAVVALFEPSRFCYSALGRFIETVGHAQERVNPRLKLAGILPSLIDQRRTDVRALMELLNEEYEEFVFEISIRRRASTGRLAFDGFIGNRELKDAVEQYIPFVKELIERV